jgi:hypothetical protein
MNIIFINDTPRYIDFILIPDNVNSKRVIYFFRFSLIFFLSRKILVFIPAIRNT